MGKLHGQTSRCCRHPGYGGIQPFLPAAHHVAPSTAWYGPASASTTQDPREGPSLTMRTTPRPPRGSASPGWLPRGGEFYARFTSCGSADVSHDDQGQAGASGRRVPVSSLVLKAQAQARSPEASGKGFHIGATRPRPAGRQDGGHHGAQDGVITRAFCMRRPLLSG